MEAIEYHNHKTVALSTEEVTPTLIHSLTLSGAIISRDALIVILPKVIICFFYIKEAHEKTV